MTYRIWIDEGCELLRAVSVRGYVMSYWSKCLNLYLG